MESIQQERKKTSHADVQYRCDETKREDTPHINRPARGLLAQWRTPRDREPKIRQGRQPSRRF